jgi:hypothetical protein
MKKPDLGRYCEAVYGCSSFITTFGFEKSDRSQNEEDEFLAYRHKWNTDLLYQEIFTFSMAIMRY